MIYYRTWPCKNIRFTRLMFGTPRAGDFDGNQTTSDIVRFDRDRADNARNTLRERIDVRHPSTMPRTRFLTRIFFIRPEKGPTSGRPLRKLAHSVPTKVWGGVSRHYRADKQEFSLLIWSLDRKKNDTFS